MKSKIYDFIIVGAGPAGSFLAYKLRQQNFNILVLEAKKEVKRKVCGEYLCPSGLNILREENIGAEFERLFPPIYGMNIFTSDNDKVESKFPGYNQGQYGLAVNRKVFDQYFIDLASHFGAEIKLDHPVKTVEYKDNLWTVQCSLEKNTLYKAKYLIGADGRNSKVAKILGLKGRAQVEKMALHCHIASHAKNERLGEMHLFSDGHYIGIDPTGRHEINLSLVCKTALLKQFKSLHDLFNFYIKQSPELTQRIGVISQETTINSITPITNTMTRFTGENFALIGDAAGFLDPLTGEGMFNALWMSQSLAREIEKLNSQEKMNLAFLRYSRIRNKDFRHKIILNKFFQFIITKPLLTKIIASFLNRRPERGHIFVGIIGNIYKPLEGLFKILSL